MNRKRHYLSTLYAIVMVTILWEIIYLSLDSFVVPEPLEVIVYTFRSLPKLWGHLSVSLMRLVVGIGLTLLVGVSLGVALGTNKILDRYITPIVYLIYPIPRIAFLPIFMILFGLGETSKIVLIFAISVFHLIVNIRDSICNLPKQLFITAQTWGLTRWQKLWNLVLPAALPSVFTSLKLVIGSSMVALFFAENYATKQGIGYYIMNAWVKVDYVEMYSGIIAISLCGMGLFKSVEWIEKKVCKWKI